jgi:hypothetical protein
MRACEWVIAEEFRCGGTSINLSSFVVVNGS